MTNYQYQCPCSSQNLSTCQYLPSNNCTNTCTRSCNSLAEYPKPIYEPKCCQPCSCPCPKPPCSCPCPKPPCPPPCPKPPTPCPCPTPCPTPCKGNAHVGMDGPTLLIGGIAGVIPTNTIFTEAGTIICQTNPLKICGPHTYLVEWSGAVNPLDDPGFAQLELLLDGKPVPGSANSTTVTLGANDVVALSGGAIVTVPAGCHTLELGYTTGPLGVEVSNINMRIVELY